MKKYGVMGAMLLSGAAFAADGIKLGGFVDAQWNWMKNASTNTFLVNDGALYVGKSMGNGEVFVDLAFASTSTTGTAFTFAGAKSQAWVSWKYDFGFRWKMGQFDTLFSRESNDSANITFAKAGMMKSVTPTTHAGLNLGYDFSDMLAFDVLVGNANGQAAMPAAAGNLDLGVKIGFKHDNMWGGLGGHFKRPVGASTGFLVDATFGMDFAPMALGVEILFADKKYNGSTESGFGIEAEFGYKALENLNLAIRGGFGSKLTALATGMTDGSRFDITVGPQWWASKDLVAKFDYTFSSTKLASTAATSTTDHAINLAAVYKF